jgi:hypothetical protein
MVKRASDRAACPLTLPPSLRRTRREAVRQTSNIRSAPPLYGRYLPPADRVQKHPRLASLLRAVPVPFWRPPCQLCSCGPRRSVHADEGHGQRSRLFQSATVHPERSRIGPSETNCRRSSDWHPPRASRNGLHSRFGFLRQPKRFQPRPGMQPGSQMLQPIPEIRAPYRESKPHRSARPPIWCAAARQHNLR